MEKISIKTEATYHNHSVKANKNIDLTFKTPYSELTKMITSLSMLNENVTVGAKLGSGKPIKLGTFMIKNVAIDNDGEGTLKINSQTDFVELDNVNKLAERSDEPLVLLMKAEIDIEEEEMDEDDSDEDDDEVTQDDLPFPDIKI